MEESAARRGLEKTLALVSSQSLLALLPLSRVPTAGKGVALAPGSPQAGRPV